MSSVTKPGDSDRPLFTTNIGSKTLTVETYGRRAYFVIKENNIKIDLSTNNIKPVLEKIIQHIKDNSNSFSESDLEKVKFSLEKIKVEHIGKTNNWYTRIANKLGKKDTILSKINKAIEITLDNIKSKTKSDDRKEQLINEIKITERNYSTHLTELKDLTTSFNALPDSDPKVVRILKGLNKPELIANRNGVVITKNHFKEFEKNLTGVIKSSEKFYNAIKDQKTITEETVKAFNENIKEYVRSIAMFQNNYPTYLDLASGLKSYMKHAPANQPLLSPDNIVSKPFQRSPRLVLFLNEMKKQMYNDRNNPIASALANSIKKTIKLTDSELDKLDNEMFRFSAEQLYENFENFAKHATLNDIKKQLNSLLDPKNKEAVRGLDSYKYETLLVNLSKLAAEAKG